MIKKAFINIFVFIAIIISVGITEISALTFNGTTSPSGDGSSTTASTGGYAVPDMLVKNSNRAVGYRFSVINASGDTVKAAYDIFRYKTNTTDGKSYIGYYKFNIKYSKRYLKANYTKISISTTTSTSNCIHDSTWGLTLPESTTGLQGWSTDANVGVVLSKVWGLSVATLKNNRWAVLVEPIFPVKLQGTYHSLTVTEIAVYGASKFGVNCNGNANNNSNSWGFIANYTNRYLPNSLRLSSACVGMPAAAAVSSRLTFGSIISNGYGAAVLYGSNLTLPVKYYLDVNGLLDGVNVGNTASYGTFDVYIGGKLVANDVTDYYQQIDSGSSYQIADIKALTGRTYGGLASGSHAISGTVTAARNIRLSFTTNKYYLDVNGFLDGIYMNTVSGCGTVDVYINGKLAADDVTDYYQQLAYGTTYQITDIKPAVERTYDGIYSDSAALAGTVTATSVVKLCFSTKEYYLDINGSLDGIYKPDISDCATADVYIDGLLVANDVTDYYKPVKSGSTYLITDIKTDTGFTYIGPFLDSPPFTGIMTAKTSVLLEFVTNTYTVSVYGVLENSIYENTEDFATFDMYIDGAITADDISEYKEQIKFDSTYTLTDIRPLEGFKFTGVAKELGGECNQLSGTIGTSHVNIFLGFEKDKKAEIVAIEPNAPYKEGTDVVSSFWAVNPSVYDFVPDDGLKVSIKISDSSGKSIVNKEISVVVPKKDKNICYIKWRVPFNLNGADVKANITILDKSRTYSTVENSYSTIPVTKYNTPDTRYEKSAPNGFTAPETPVTEQRYATWQEYVYEDGEFKKKDYAIGIYTKNIHKIEPASSGSATQKNGVWSMKSGYGITLQSCCCCISVSGYLLPNFNCFTAPQYAYALFPEYGYEYTENTVQTLDASVISGYRYWRFPQNKNYGNVHFTPLWYPDGKYTVKVVETDCWTPCGMITTTNVPAAVNINGNMYSDHYIGR